MEWPWAGMLQGHRHLLEVWGWDGGSRSPGRVGTGAPGIRRCSWALGGGGTVLAPLWDDHRGRNRTNSMHLAGALSKENRAGFFLYPFLKVKAPQSCPTLCDPMDYTVHGIFQARILEWVAFPFSRGSSWPRNYTGVSCTADRFFTSWATREAAPFPGWP